MEISQHRETHIGKRAITVEKGWPAAAAVELGAALVERSLASSAGIDPDIFVMFVLPRSSLLGALQTEHSELRRSHKRWGPCV